MRTLLILKDNGNEGSNNSAKILARNISNCDMACLSDSRDTKKKFYSKSDGGFSFFNSVRLKKNSRFLEYLLFFSDIYYFYIFFKKCGYNKIILNNAMMLNIAIAALIARKETYIFIRELHMPRIVIKFYHLLSMLVGLKLLSNNSSIKKIYPYIDVCVINNLVEIKPIKSKIINSSEIKVLLVGSIYELKNQKLAIEIVETIRRKFNYNVTIDHFGGVVSSSYNSELIEYIRSLGLSSSVNFKGKIRNEYLMEKYSDYDIYIQSSQSEGMSRALLDAVNNGLLVIATDVGDTSLLINSETGILIDSADLNFSLDEFDVVFNNRARIVKKAHNELINQYSKEAINMQLVNAGLNEGLYE